MKESNLPGVAPGGEGVNVPILDVWEEVLNRSHAKLVRSQIHNRESQVQEALLDKEASMVAGIIQHEDSLLPPVLAETIQVTN